MTVDPLALHALVCRHAGDLDRHLPTDDFLRTLALDVVDLLGVVGCGISLVRDQELEPAFVNDEALAPLERVQHRLRRGPRFSAWARGEGVFIDCVATYAETWPDFAEAARDGGLGSVAALPLRVAGRTVGVGDFYHREERAWTPAARTDTALVADVCATLIANALHHREAQTRIRQLQQALDSRIVVEQAKGMVANQWKLDVDQAFVLLRRYATDHRTPLREVAEAVVRYELDVDT